MIVCEEVGQGVYPRVGGGNRLARREREGPEGLSPRGRGKLSGSREAIRRRGSIPAWAGETRQSLGIRRMPGVYPRVGGGNRPAAQTACLCQGLSPRGRGKHRLGD